MGRKTVVYYPDAHGRSSVLEFLHSLDLVDQQRAFVYISYLKEYGEALRRPIADYVGEKLYELRPRQLRILYAFVGTQYAVIVHAFRKKTAAVPTHEKRLAQTRLADFVLRHAAGMITIEG